MKWDALKERNFLTGQNLHYKSKWMPAQILILIPLAIFQIWKYSSQRIFITDLYQKWLFIYLGIGITLDLKQNLSLTLNHTTQHEFNFSCRCLRIVSRNKEYNMWVQPSLLISRSNNRCLPGLCAPDTQLIMNVTNSNLLIFFCYKEWKTSFPLKRMCSAVLNVIKFRNCISHVRNVVAVHMLQR